MMQVGTTIYGVHSTLQFLRRFEPELYKGIEKDLQGKTEPLRKAVADGFPDRPWRSTKPIMWEKYGRTKRGRKPTGQAGASFPKYDPAVVKRGVKTQVGGRKIRKGVNAGAYPVLRIKQTAAAGVIYDLAKDSRAGTAQSEKFVGNLAKMGSPSRVMWKKVEQNYPLIQRDITDAVNAVEKRFNAEIATYEQKNLQQSQRVSQQARNALGRFSA